MVLGGTLRPLPSEPIATICFRGASPGFTGRGNCAIARAATPVAVPDSPPPPVHDDLGATADGGPIEALHRLGQGVKSSPEATPPCTP